MAIIISPPDIYEGPKKASIFLGGGISGAPLWQDEMIEMLKDMDIVIYNPRRKEYDIHDGEMGIQQIKWEFEHLRKADGISFWFPKEAKCIITMYELGAWSMTKKGIFLGVEDGYERQLDVREQTKLARPDVRIFNNLEVLAKDVRGFMNIMVDIIND